jgi:rare lipoprotein A
MKTLILSCIGVLLIATTTPTQHVATWYNMHGSRTASGAIMHRDSLTAAYNSARFGTRLEVTNPVTAAKCTVTVNDRMGVQTSNRIDLSYAAFGRIAKHAAGRIQVTVRHLN